MLNTCRPRALLRTIVLSVLVVLPLALSAKGVDELQRIPAEQVVTRGEFIRAAIDALKIQTDGTIVSLPYQRVPRALEPYVNIAYEKDALDTFGDDLLLARGISRGQAIEVIVALQNLRSSRTVDFTDVPAGTALEDAIRVVIEEGWMSPLRENLFGVRRMLTGKDAVLLLRKVLGEGGFDDAGFTQPVETSQTIRVNFTTQQRQYNLPKTQMLEAIWRIINEEFIYNDRIDTEEAAYKAIEGLVDSLDDPYTSFLRPLKNRSFQTQISGEVTGIGAQVEDKDGVLTIVTPIRGSPAEAAGLQPGDQVLSVDGENIVDIGFLEAVDKVRGPRGTRVKLRIRRDGIEFDVEVTRDVIRVPEVVITWQEDVVVVQLTQFGKLTEDELRNQMVEIQKKNPKGVILDLRNNPGGLLNAAQVVVSNFVPKGTGYVEIRSRTGERVSTTLSDQTIDSSVPVIVLVNKGSASASEIVAGALQDVGRATIVGTTTFGKGTVQQVLQFNDQSSLKITIAEWYTPLGRKINGQGIPPDIEVIEEDDRDEPMLKALELLR